MATYRIDELARAADTTVRNVRSLQERGVLHAPERQGRIAVYDDSHLARIRLVGQLQERGHTMATIAELVTAWENGRDLGDVLGLEKALTDPWSDEIPDRVDSVGLAKLFFPGKSMDEVAALPPDLVRGILTRAEELGFIRPDGDHYKIPSPRLLGVGAELVAAGIPLSTVFEIAERVSADCDTIAGRFVQLTVDRGNLDDTSHNAVRQDLPEVTELIQRLRPLSQVAVQALLARSMEAQIRARTSEQLTKIAQRRR
ncbi:MerR family transcriptional regulator [Spirillospora sp. CA-294931]|uniref:MerR family transcriptional regulator n=1 Tax=Spirillospora sp. CA-294931 TaxID=3240042 RepID=UPI003D9287BF